MFQFPSSGKADPKKSLERPDGLTWDDMFQFPSSGKADPKSYLKMNYLTSVKVSIPFKRESGSKVDEESTQGDEPQGFQFPSSGKADPKGTT